MSGFALRRGLPAALIAITLLANAPAPARANAEEFSSFDVAQQEEDDESLLDHVLTRTPYEWRDEWEHAPQAFRTSQGCLTAGQWFLINDLKLRTALGTKSTFGLEMRQSHDNVESFDYLGLSFGFPTRWGTTSIIFQPSYDKSRQDFSLRWELGADTTALQVQATFTVEDMLNNLWAFRQTRVGNASEPYLVHPYEPELRVVTRHATWRAEAGGRWLTPSRRKVFGETPADPNHERYLWGALGYGTLEMRALGLEWEARATNQQASSTDQALDFSGGDHLDFRRQWSAEATLRRRLSAKFSASVHWMYQVRTQLVGQGIGPGAFGGIDRLAHGELAWLLSPGWIARVGAMVDRISIDRRGAAPWITYGTRKESRAYLGLAARFGRVSVEGIEGIELDHEPYEVTFHHDKGFLKLQTTF